MPKQTSPIAKEMRKDVLPPDGKEKKAPMMKMIPRIENIEEKTCPNTSLKKPIFASFFRYYFPLTLLPRSNASLTTFFSSIRPG